MKYNPIWKAFTASGDPICYLLYRQLERDIELLSGAGR